MENAHIKKGNYIKKPKPKKCRVCGLENRNFGTRLNGHGTRYYNLICTTCKGRQDTARKKSWIQRLRTDDPTKYARYTRNRQLKRYYGITIEEYETLLEKQKGCAICGKKVGLHNMPVDHDHVTMKVRGILCHWCNKGLGQFFDDPRILRSAAEYIDSWNEKCHM